MTLPPFTIPVTPSRREGATFFFPIEDPADKPAHRGFLVELGGVTSDARFDGFDTTGSGSSQEIFYSVTARGQIAAQLENDPALSATVYLMRAAAKFTNTSGKTQDITQLVFGAVKYGDAS